MNRAKRLKFALIGVAACAAGAQVGPQPVSCFVCEKDCTTGTCAPSGITVCDQQPRAAGPGEAGWTRVGGPYLPRNCTTYSGGGDTDYVSTPCDAESPGPEHTNIGPCGMAGGCCYVRTGNVTTSTFTLPGSVGTCKGSPCTGGGLH